MITRDEAFALLSSHVQAGTLRKHCLATEAILRALARRLGEDEALWGIVGLVHDLDFEATANAPAEHTKATCDILRPLGFPDHALQAVREHNAEALGIPRESRLGIALACGETLTGLIVATALVMPDKRLASVAARSVLKRMKKKDFARNVSREIIGECERLAIPLEDFVQLSLTAMQGVAGDLGL
ncbi:MAG TPA: HDIG domain-containing protein [Planctomycetota bacterium]|nr:HDIG domain-containing protein [Planctomycetota bacterium]HRR80307.1 HDIG domain-containing protein [Planctomycetota bacterium]HRT96127.1 HDIG domain-containing protein [Planctomycetota bacterium]